MRPMRAFLAVNLSMETTRLAAAVSTGLKKRLEGFAIAWVPPTHLHVTVRFLGYCHEAVVPALRDRLTDLAHARAPFRVRGKGVFALPNPAQPRVLYIGIEDLSGELAKLASEVETMCRSLGFESDNRLFLPHLTIARVKGFEASDSGAEAKDIGGTLEPLLLESQAVDLGLSWVSEIVLYESQSRPAEGSRVRAVEYMAHARVPFTQRAAKALGERDGN